MRTLGIDFGERRIGLAISDEEGRVAVPLETFERRDDRRAVGRIRAIVRREGVGSLVVGEPVNVDGTRGAAAERVRRFAERLGRESGLPVEMVDESLTSVEARRRLTAAGVDLRRHRERIDSTAAQILLEEALERRRGQRRAGCGEPL